MKTMQITENFTVSEQIQAGDVDLIANAGYTIVICNRPDQEDPGQPHAREIAAACASHGLAFHHLPFKGSEISAEIVTSFREIIENAGGPVFAYCRSGQRCAFLWVSAMH